MSPRLWSCLVAFAAAQVAASAEQDVEFRSGDGFVLAGSLFEAGQGAPAAILLHQCTGTDRRGFADLGAALAVAGVSAFAFDFRGFGDSRDGRYRDFHLQMAETEAHFPGDVDAAFAWLRERLRLSPEAVAVLGASCGCEQAVRLAARQPGMSGVACVSGSLTDTGHAMFSRVSQLPFFVAYSESDAYGTPESMSRLFREARHPDSKAALYKGRIHGVALFEHDPNLVGVVVGWLGRVLGR